MIEHSWHSVFTPGEAALVRAMLAECAAVDEEAGFPQLTLDGDGSEATHLLVWLLPDDRSGPEESGERRLAAYLRLDPAAEGTSWVSYVVRPDCRSRGVTTMLVEQLGPRLGLPVDEAGRLAIWARADHPAADRLADRFGIQRACVEWQLLAPLRPAAADPAGSALTGPGVTGPGVTGPGVAGARPAGPEEDLSVLCNDPPADARVLVAGSPDAPGSAVRGAVWFDAKAAEWTEYGPAGRIHAVRGEPLGPLLSAALAELAGAGLRVAVITVGSAEERLLHEARMRGFQHDQTDVQYVV